MTRTHLHQRSQRNGRVAAFCGLAAIAPVVPVIVLPDPHPWLHPALMVALCLAPMSFFASTMLGVLSLGQSRRAGARPSAFTSLTLVGCFGVLVWLVFALVELGSWSELGNWTR